MEGLHIGEEDGIETYLNGVRWDGVGWVRVTEDRVQWRAVVSAAFNLRVPCKARNFMSS
jgi:hypothetical protein